MEAHNETTPDASARPDAAEGAGDSMPRVEFMRIRQAIRSARAVYAMSAVALVVAAAGLAQAQETGYVALAVVPGSLAAAHAMGWLRAVREPLIWPRRMALLVTVEFGVVALALLVQAIRGEFDGDGVENLALAVAGVLVAWDAVPRGSDAELLAEHGADWPRYLERYATRPRRRRA